MSSRAQRAERLLVGLETAAGSGLFDLDERLRVEEVRQHADVSPGSATLSVRLDADFDSVEARRRYHPDRRIQITTDEADESQRTILFVGYPPVQSARWDGRIGHEDEQFVFEAEHVFDRAARSREALIYGRHVRSAGIENGLVDEPEAYAARSVLMTALPCVFNPDGVPNRAPAPLQVSGSDGLSLRVHPFTHDGAIDARPWSYATMLRYLLWFYLRSDAGIDASQVFAITAGLATETGLPGSALETALAREPRSLTCEATNLAEALDLVLASAGLKLSVDEGLVGDQNRSALRLWLTEDGPLRVLRLARGGQHPDGTPWYDTTMRSATQILQDNNTYRGQVTWDDRKRVTASVVIGDVKKYEMTVPLWPGWAPRGGLDSVATEDRADAKAAALLPEEIEALGDLALMNDWFRFHHRQGDQFAAGSDVARLWVLNEDGRFDGQLYNRHAPFDNYRPFDFAAVAEASVLVPGAWMRRPRPLLPLISTSTDRRPLGVWVEISFDSGATWHQQAGGVRVLNDRAGIYLDVENPTATTPSGIDPSEQNMWYALIDQTFRVRVTASFESDDRIVARASSPSEPARLSTKGMVIRRPRALRFHSRQHTTHALRETTLGSEQEHDDTLAARQLAQRMADAGQPWEVRSVPALPWIETGYALGDRITEVRGQYLRLATSGRVDADYPAIVARRYVLRDGRYDTELTLGQAGAPMDLV